MKGSKIHPTKYLDSEYYEDDEYLNCPDDEPNNLDALFESFCRQEHVIRALTLNDKSEKPYPANISLDFQELWKPNQRLTRLCRSQIQSLVDQLGEDAQNCVRYPKEIELVDNPGVLERYKDIYKKFHTIPVIFLSVVPNNRAVYLWQINRVCPFQKVNQLILDAKALNSEVVDHISFLLLAKITPEVNEEIIGTQIVGGTHLLVKSISREGEITIRTYHINRFLETTRVNPFKQIISANNLYSDKIVLKRIEKDNWTLEATLWKKKSFGEMSSVLGTENQQEEILLQRKAYQEGPLPDIMNATSFDRMFKTEDNVFVLVDKYSASVVAWKDTDIFITHYDVVITGGIEQANSSIFFEDKNTTNYEIDLRLFPIVKLRQVSAFDNIRSLTEAGKRNKFKENVLFYYNHPHHGEGEGFDLLVYNNTNFYLKNPRFALRKTEVKEVNEENERNEEQEKTIILDKRLHKIKKEFKHKNNQGIGLEDVREMIKEVQVNLEERMSNEGLEFYGELKKAKQRLVRVRQKERTQLRNSRLQKDDYVE